MEELWCWRCRRIVPMLNEREWPEVEQRLVEGSKAVKDARKHQGLPIEAADLEEPFRPALDAFERITGYRETDHQAMGHHRIWLYGPRCARCGKPLRTPRAKVCAACGTPRRCSGDGDA